MRVRDIMSRPVHWLREADSVEVAAALLATRSITAAPVLDEDGELVGMVSEGDLLKGRVSKPAPRRGIEEDWARPAVVGQVMSRPVVSTRSEADVADAAQAMLEHNVRSVPVVDDGELVGIISRRDILRTFVRTDDVLCAEVQHRLDEYAGGLRRWHATVTEGVATVGGEFGDEFERIVIPILVRTVPGVVDVIVRHPQGERFECG